MSTLPMGNNGKTMETYFKIMLGSWQDRAFTKGRSHNLMIKINEQTSERISQKLIDNTMHRLDRIAIHSCHLL